MLGTALSVLCAGATARAELTNDAMHERASLLERAREATASHASLMLHFSVPNVLAAIQPDMKPKRVSAVDQVMREDLEAPSPTLYCYGPNCSMTMAVMRVRGEDKSRAPQLGATKFISNMGSGPAAILAYFCTPPKHNGATYRFSLVSAIGGPAFGLRVRW